MRRTGWVRVGLTTGAARIWRATDLGTTSMTITNTYDTHIRGHVYLSAVEQYQCRRTQLNLNIYDGVPSIQAEDGMTIHALPVPSRKSV